VTHASERGEPAGHADPWTGAEHRLLRGTVRALVEREIVPHLATWERQGELPRSLSRRFGEAGLLGAGWPEEVGGSGGDITHAAARHDRDSRILGIGGGTGEIMHEIIARTMGL
jgi:alkylation response protein AidB-like acyl-CoA dehydrogenase